MAQTCALIAPVQPVLYRVSCSNETLPNAPKHYETQQNMSLWSNGMDRVRSLRKILMRFHGTNLCINCTSSTHFAPSSCSNETLPNAPKYYKTHQFMCSASNELDQVRSLRKTLMQFRGTNFFINCTNSTRFLRVSCSNETNPKCTQTVRNKPILEFRVQWGGSGAFVAKNSNVT